MEALIAGWGMDEALRRAEAYRRAGADAILIHSKLSKPDEILTFAREWAGRGPLVIVPTKYYSTPTDVFRKAGISMVIWANHLMRAATCRDAERRQGNPRQPDAGQRRRPHRRRSTRSSACRTPTSTRPPSGCICRPRRVARSAVVLAASRGAGLEAMTDDRPKVMLPIAGKPLLRWLVDGFKKESINDITVVGGYRADAIDTAGIKLVVNERYAETGELASLACAVDKLEADTVISYGDLLFRSYVLRDLAESEADVSRRRGFVAGRRRATGRVRDFAYCSRADDRGLFGTPGAAEARVERQAAAATDAQDAAAAAGSAC